MNLILSLYNINQQDLPLVGGKGFALAMMVKESMTVPDALCITTEAYHRYMRSTGLRENLVMALYRKAFKDMRWEEIWDTALRIRNLFLQTEIPDDLRNSIASALESSFEGKTVSVRSSAPGEDSSKTSFAGLHESFINIRGTEAILKHVRLVWASLWSDRALLYRQELGLDVEKSAMAVVVQRMILGERSGVVFGRSPTDESQAVIEAVYGLNQGLVDGTVEPDRWILGRSSGEILSHLPAMREKVLNPAPLGTRLENLSPELREKAPLEKGDVSEVFRLAMRAESLFKSPQDVEWTYRKNRLHALQARPITTGTTSDDEERLRYLGLHRSFENLKTLRTKIEKDLLPVMEAEASSLAAMKLANLSNVDLADEIERRMGIHKKWVEAYWHNCIPFAHGMRMFGQIYNDVVNPKDPFEFVDLLRGTRMVSIQRNQILEELAGTIRKDPQLAECLKLKGIEDCDPAFHEAFNNLSNTFGELTWGETSFIEDHRQLLGFLLEMAARPPVNGSLPLKNIDSLEANFLSLFDEAQKKYATELLDLGRASYRLRDDDNIYLGKIEGQLRDALIEGKKRIEKILGADPEHLETPEIVKALRNGHTMPTKSPSPPEAQGIGNKGTFHLKARQIVGQPAGPGIAFGKAHVVIDPADLFAFKAGEILVCDAVDPNMTFVVPLAAGIVERRGGMLIHGAIIAREYGLPCVTGVAGAAKMIKTGDFVTVDGYLGIITIGETSSQAMVSSNQK